MEQWIIVPNFDGKYLISSLGRIKRICSHYVRKRLVETVHILNPETTRNGYLRVTLYKNGKPCRFLVHRLVYEVFNGPIPEGMEVNHINECSWDNRIENLNLLSRTDNINWGTRNKRAAISNTNNPLKSKPVIQYDLYGNTIKTFPSIKQVKRDLGFDDGNIIACCKGKYKTAYGFVWRYAV